MSKPLTEDELYRSFRAAERFFNSEFNAGKITREKARELTEKARKNYSNQNYNRQLDKCSGTKK